MDALLSILYMINWLLSLVCMMDPLLACKVVVFGLIVQAFLYDDNPLKWHNWPSSSLWLFRKALRTIIYCVMRTLVFVLMEPGSSQVAISAATLEPARLEQTSPVITGKAAPPTDTNADLGDDDDLESFDDFKDRFAWNKLTTPSPKSSSKTSPKFLTAATPTPPKKPVRFSANIESFTFDLTYNPQGWMSGRSVRDLHGDMLEMDLVRVEKQARLRASLEAPDAESTGPAAGDGGGDDDDSVNGSDNKPSPKPAPKSASKPAPRTTKVEDLAVSTPKNVAAHDAEAPGPAPSTDGIDKNSPESMKSKDSLQILQTQHDNELAALKEQFAAQGRAMQAANERLQTQNQELKDNDEQSQDALKSSEKKVAALKRNAKTYSTAADTILRSTLQRHEAEALDQQLAASLKDPVQERLLYLSRVVESLNTAAQRSQSSEALNADLGARVQALERELKSAADHAREAAKSHDESNQAHDNNIRGLQEQLGQARQRLEFQGQTLSRFRELQVRLDSALQKIKTQGQVLARMADLVAGFLGDLELPQQTLNEDRSNVGDVLEQATQQALSKVQQLSKEKADVEAQLSMLQKGKDAVRETEEGPDTTDGKGKDTIRGDKDKGKAAPQKSCLNLDTDFGMTSEQFKWLTDPNRAYWDPSVDATNLTGQTEDWATSAIPISHPSQLPQVKAPSADVMQDNQLDATESSEELSQDQASQPQLGGSANSDTQPQQASNANQPMSDAPPGYVHSLEATLLQASSPQASPSSGQRDLAKLLQQLASRPAPHLSAQQHLGVMQPTLEANVAQEQQASPSRDPRLRNCSGARRAWAEIERVRAAASLLEETRRKADESAASSVPNKEPEQHQG